jgi:predicted nucleic acid-binding protein
LFLDVNVYLDAFIAWYDDMRPSVLVTADNVALAGPPACALFTAIREGRSVNDQRLVLHASDRVLELVAAALVGEYGWEHEVTIEAVDWIIRAVLDSGGMIVPPQISPAVVPGLSDMEDAYRVAEARAVSAELFLTRDREILDTADANERPFPMTPRSFVNRSRRS